MDTPLYAHEYAYMNKFQSKRVAYSNRGRLQRRQVDDSGERTGSAGIKRIKRGLTHLRPPRNLHSLSNSSYCRRRREKQQSLRFRAATLASVSRSGPVTRLGCPRWKRLRAALTGFLGGLVHGCRGTARLRPGSGIPGFRLRTMAPIQPFTGGATEKHDRHHRGKGRGVGELDSHAGEARGHGGADPGSSVISSEELDCVSCSATVTHSVTAKGRRTANAAGTWSWK